MKEWDIASSIQKVLDKGYVRLDGALADDLSVVNSARVSFNKHATEMGPPERGLVNFLMKNRHGTPFEHNLFRFEIKAPIFVAREWMRHRVGSFNEWSGRYSELEQEFYVPALEDVRQQVGKPGAYHFEPVSAVTAENFRCTLQYANEVCWDVYRDFIEGVGRENPIEGTWASVVDPIAKELARLVLPVNIYTKFFWSVNARSLMNFLSLRNDEQAMREIRQYAIALENILEWKMPVTYAAFAENGRQAP